MMYYEGEGVPQDYDKSMALLKKVDPRLAAQAQYSLAVMYAQGSGLPQNDALSKAWFKKSCDSGHPDACKHTQDAN